MSWRRRMCPLQITPCAIPKPITLRTRATEKLEHEPTYMPDKPKFPLWVKADIRAAKSNFRFTRKRTCAVQPGCPLWANSGHHSQMVRQCEQSVAAYLFVHMMFAEEAQRYPGNDRNQR
jgi:hypothetical protein